MNHTDNVRYIKNQLRKIYNKSTEVTKHNIADNSNKSYKLNNPAIHEVCLVNSLEKLNKLLSVEILQTIID